MQDINEVFSELDSRIDVLKFLWKQENQSQVTISGYNIGSIESNLFRFKDEAVERIDITVEELNQLLSRGISLIPEDIFYGYTPDGTNFTEADLIKDAQKDREDAYKYIKAEIDFYITKLTKIRNTIEIKQADKNQSPIIKIASDFKFPDVKTINPTIKSILSKDQIALLFYFLMQNKIVLPFDDTAVSKLLMMLTGYSENTLRSSFGAIHDIKYNVPNKSKKADQEQSNLHIIKEVLQAIILEIDIDLKAAPKRK